MTNKNLAIIITMAVLPLVLLALGIYGSFSFTFPVAIIWQLAVAKEGLASLGLKRTALAKSIVLGILSGVIISSLGGYLLRLLGMTDYSIEKVQEANHVLQRFGLEISFRGELGYRLLTAGGSLKWILLSLAFCVFLVGLGEEVFWRGFIQKKFSKKLSKHLSVWITAVIFGSIHFYLFFVLPFREGALFLGLITLAGAFWGYLYEYSGNIWAPSISHGIAAFVVWRYFVFKV